MDVRNSFFSHAEFNDGDEDFKERDDETAHFKEEDDYIGHMDGAVITVS